MLWVVTDCASSAARWALQGDAPERGFGIQAWQESARLQRPPCGWRVMFTRTVT